MKEKNFRLIFLLTYNEPTLRNEKDTEKKFVTLLHQKFLLLPQLLLRIFQMLRYGNGGWDRVPTIEKKM